MWNWLKRRPKACEIPTVAPVGLVVQKGQHVTIRDSEEVPGLIGMPMEVLTVNSPFVVVMYQSISGHIARTSLDTRKTTFMSAPKAYRAALNKEPVS